jgi:D-lactate dehydrogenase
LACPVHIDTGKFVKHWRADAITDTQKKVANYIGSNMESTTAMMRMGLKVVSFFHSVFGTRIMSSISSVMHWISRGTIPKWIPQIPKGADKIK